MFHNEESLLSEFVTIKLTFEIYFLTGLNGTNETPQKNMFNRLFPFICEILLFVMQYLWITKFFPPQFGGWNLRQIADVLVVYVM